MHYRRITLHDTIRPFGCWAIRIRACVFSAVQGLQRVHNVPYERHMENLHHKPDDAIDCLIIVGFPECEHDTSSDDKQNQEGGEQSHHPVHGKTWVERALRIDETPCVKVDDVAQRLEERSHGAGPRYCDAHNERLYLQVSDQAHQKNNCAEFGRALAERFFLYLVHPVLRLLLCAPQSIPAGFYFARKYHRCDEPGKHQDAEEDEKKEFRVLFAWITHISEHVPVFRALETCFSLVSFGAGVTPQAPVGLVARDALSLASPP